MFWYKYPYSNLHDLNLDWLIKAMMELQQYVADFVSYNKLKYADPIQWDITNQYEANTIVVDKNGDAYLSVRPVPSGVSLDNTDYWTIIGNFSELWKNVKHAIEPNDEYHSQNATKNYAVGDYVWIEDHLYKVISAITAGYTFVEGVNIQEIDVMSQIKANQAAITIINNQIADLNQGLQDLSDSVDDRIQDFKDDVDHDLDQMRNDIADIPGEVNADLESKFNQVFISNIRDAHPDYTDDQLMSAAIIRATELGSHPQILWDEHDAHFSGNTMFVLNKTSGVDFHGVNVYMPENDGTLFRISADDAQDTTATSSSFGQYSTSNSGLFNKYFAINTSTQGAAAMCAGDRYGGTGQIYCCQGLVTDGKGQFINTKANYIPSAETALPLYNVHSIPDFYTEICNANLIYTDTDKMKLFVSCRRSKVHIHHISVSGIVSVTSYHTGVISLTQCAYIEIDHIYGVNPIQVNITSGYVVSFFDGCSDIYMHDCDLHDTTVPSWAGLGINCITNFVMERVNTQRFDCHYFSWGYVTVRDCNLDFLTFSSGVADWVVDHVNFTRRLPNFYYVISLRTDSPARLAGSITISNCRVRVDTSYGADIEHTRMICLAMVHGVMPGNNISTLPNSNTTLIVKDMRIEGVMAVLESFDVTNEFSVPDMFMNNVVVQIPSVTNSQILYKHTADTYGGINRMMISNSILNCQRLISAPLNILMMDNVKFNPLYFIDIRNNDDHIQAQFTGCSFGGFNPSLHPFYLLIVSGCHLDASDTQWSTGVALNYVLSGNYTRDTVNQAAWFSSKSF